MTDYTDYPGLAGVYLEDSYVLSIHQDPDRTNFLLEAVLTSESPAYHDPPQGDRYCFARGNLLQETEPGEKRDAPTRHHAALQKRAHVRRDARIQRIPEIGEGRR